MKTFLIALLSFVIGGVVGVLGGGLLGAGIGAGAGIVTGMQAGACLAVETAKNKGLITSDQVGTILAGAAGSIRTQAEQIKADPWAGAVSMASDAECQAVIAKLKQAARKQ